ncbi:DUF5336 domain-containing protein [Mycobacterium sp. IDR2000157661]|uniref:DUF5336 domain-containing protein n=1 Tax=Mycobacterium sp. IDR2000157661 TaxID=2867005 RepID=UPI001EEA9680|nr:DUF5336 domain-containing protein [Mycobacterium sp. IDR2000157661]ULE31261.1 DUF5336 domain-containing protein [Mycobacterium sp. IDR2000157661]
MTYPSGPPGSPGYPPAQQPTPHFSAPTQQFGRPGESGPADGRSKLPLYLAAVVAALGLAVYLSSFAPLFTISASDFPGLGSISGSSFGLVLAIGAAILAGLFAGAGLLPKQRVATAVIAALAVTAFLLVIAEVINKPSGASIGWGLYLIIAFTLLQAIAAVAVLLFESGIITPPSPRPKYDQHYGQYGAPGSYYGQPGQPHHGGPQQGQPQQQQRSGYPSTYPGGYGQGPSTGGYSSGQQSGPPTPPTGFPTYGQPPSSTAPTTQVPTQGSSSSQSGQTPS